MASTGLEANISISFGYGKHACPGRFYAVRKVKLMFSMLILKYEMKWVGNVFERPPSLSICGQFVPNQDQKLYIRKRPRSEVAASVAQCNEGSSTAGLQIG